MDSQRMQRGAPLPYKLLAGVEPCPGGWLMVAGKLQGISVFPHEPEVFAHFTEILDYRPSPTVVAVHIPLGLMDEPVAGGRSCDRAARKLLGWPRGAAVFSAPTRAAVAAATREEARAANGDRLSAVTWNLMPRIREAAREIQPYWQRTVHEVNPELAFQQINDDVPMRFGKRTSVGVKERRDLLENKIEGAARTIDTQVKGASTRHIIDAVANLWTARRIVARAAQRLPEDPEWDTEGLRMEILR